MMSPPQIDDVPARRRAHLHVSSCSAPGFGNTGGQELDLIRAHLGLTEQGFSELRDKICDFVHAEGCDCILTSNAGRQEACRKLLAKIRTWPRADVSRLLYADDVNQTHRPYALYRLIFYERRNKTKRTALRKKALEAEALALVQVGEEGGRMEEVAVADMPEHIPEANLEASVSHPYIDSGLSEIEKFLRA